MDMRKGLFIEIWCNDSGAAAFIIAIAFAIVAVAATLLLSGSGPERQLSSARSTAADIGQVRDAISVYVTQDVNQYLPCPADGTISGGARGFSLTAVGGACLINAGIVPFRTLGLSETSVTDAYGAAITLIVDDLSLDVCEGTAGRSGNLTVSGGAQLNALYALVSHGENRRGGYLNGGTQISVPGTAVEADNCPNGAACTDPDFVSVTVGPHTDDGGGDMHFDDVVSVADSTDFDGLCLVIHGP